MSAKALNNGLYFRRSELFSWVCCIFIGGKLFQQQGEQLFLIVAAAWVFVDGEGDVLQFALHFVQEAAVDGETALLEDALYDGGGVRAAVFQEVDLARLGQGDLYFVGDGF